MSCGSAKLKWRVWIDGSRLDDFDGLLTQKMVQSGQRICVTSFRMPSKGDSGIGMG